MRFHFQSYIPLFVFFCLGFLPHPSITNVEEVIDSGPALKIVVVKKDNIDERLFKSLKIVKVDTFNFTPITTSTDSATQYTVPLTTSSTFSVSYNKLASGIDFLGSPGDTVLIELKHDTLIINNTKEQIITPKQYLSATYKRLASHRHKLDSLLDQILSKKHLSRGFFYQRKEGTSWDQYLKFRPQIVRALKELYAEEGKVADSLLSRGVLSTDFASFVRINDKCNKVWLLTSLSQSFEGGCTIQDFTEFNFFDPSSVYGLNGNYRGFLGSVVLTDLILKRKTIKFSDDFSGFDYRTGFDSSGNYLTGANLDYVKYFCLLRIKEQFSKGDFQKYSKKFFEQVKDPIIRSYVLNNIAYDDDFSNVKDLMSDAKNEFTEFNSLLTRNRVVYVDFWASWCLPCREALPASIKLREFYKGKDVDFVYISIDELKPNWQNAIVSEGLHNYPLSFLLNNPREAAIIKSNEINSIPRYMLFDRAGKLTYKNAPDPASPELKIIIDSLLKQ